MKKIENSLVDNYLATAPIGQITNMTEVKIEWMKLNIVKYFPKPNSFCLEIGPGQGELLLLWQELGYKNFRSIDISKDVCLHVHKLGFECELVEDDSIFLEKHKNSYDLIVMNDVLEHVPREKVVGLMKSIFSSLKPGGKVIIKVPNAQSPHFSVGRYGDLTHEQSFTELSLTQLFIASGFNEYNYFAEKVPFKLNIKSLLAIYIIRPLYFWWIRNIRSATGCTSPKILTQAIIAVAEKK